MRDVVLLELAARWEQDAITPDCQDGSPEAEIPNAKAQGHRECKRECADTLRALVDIIGDSQQKTIQEPIERLVKWRPR